MSVRQVRVYLRVATPLFMGGADPAKAEWRIPSIKGLLRWWYRASHPVPPDQPIEQSLAELCRNEARLFGGVGSSQDHDAGQGHGQGNGQGLFLLRSSCSLPPLPENNVKQLLNDAGHPSLGYLGYGLVIDTKSQHFVHGAIRARGDDRAPKSSPAIPADADQADAELTFVFRPGCSDDDIEAVLTSLWLLCHLGGMGARSRRGMGSVNWISCEELPPPDSMQEELASPTVLQGWPPQASDVDTLVGNIQAVIKRLSLPQLWESGTAPYTCFCRGTTILVGGRPYQSWEKALEAVGTCLQQHRSVLSQAPKYTDDYQLIDGFLNNQQIDHPPRRAVFGLPHNYFFRSTGKKAGVNAVGRGAGSEINRRASPLLIHIEQLASSGPAFVPVVTFFPTAFLPPGGGIRVHSGKGSQGRSVVFYVDPAQPRQGQQSRQGQQQQQRRQLTVDYGPITAFLGELKDALGAQEVKL